MLEITGNDNRGDAEYAYGFVYFNDDRRVAYTKDNGVVIDATGGWPAITVMHARLAADYLRSKGLVL